MIVKDFFNDIISTDVNMIIKIDFFKLNMVL